MDAQGRWQSGERGGVPISRSPTALACSPTAAAVRLNRTALSNHWIVHPDLEAFGPIQIARKRIGAIPKGVTAVTGGNGFGNSQETSGGLAFEG